ncbi:unnamed protein product [Rangifer tarandus platyrhynchus]|uniref:Uncharacterized protein n=1 Tax=Rangifer tarandus platyrhynchus TaxID=3082113 RepID=A0ABN8Z4X8_RANTA|nr:unnamed protein product [Rangifer tarandus platyrhynchus]
MPWSRKWQPTPVLLPGKSHGQRSLEGYSPWGRKESDMTERLYLFYFGFCSVEAVEFELRNHEGVKGLDRLDSDLGCFQYKSEEDSIGKEHEIFDINQSLVYICSQTTSF